MTRLISGLIRQKGYARGGDRKRLITLSGSSTGIRLNEKILYYVNEAAKLAQDGITIDINDVTRKADLLLQSGLTSLTTEAIINAGGVVASSDVENFIASLAIEFGEAQDLCNTLEEQSNGEIFVDENDLVQFRHQLQPLPAGKGFAIKNKNISTDNADDTCYLRGKSWDYTESCLKSDSYSSFNYALLSPDPTPQASDYPINLTGIVGNSTNDEIAQKFRPTHSHFFPGDIWVFGKIVGNPATTQPHATRFRIVQDSAGIPLNVGGVVANIEFQPKAFGMSTPNLPTDPDWVLTNEQVFYNTANVKIDSFDLDTSKNYWFLLSDDNAATAYSAIQLRGTTTATRAVNTGVGNSTNANGGSGYTIFTGQPAFWFAMPRVRAEAFQCSDPKAVAAIGHPIESTLGGVPATIKTREAMYRYMINQQYYMARPRSNWNMATVTAPNVPVLPGDPLLISDSVLGFSAAGGQAVMTTCGDMTYLWQIGNYQAPTLLSIQPVGLPTRYK